MRNAKLRTILVAAVLLGAVAARAMESAYSDWPLERIVANLEQRLLSSPDDAQLHYNLGRAHGFAFALERSSLWATDHTPWVKDLDAQRRMAELPTMKTKSLGLPPPTPAELLAHLSKGVQHLRRAYQLATGPESRGGFWATESELGLAWLLETGAHLASRVETRSLFELEAIELSEQDVAQVQLALRDVWQASDRRRIRRDLEPSFLAKMARYCAERAVSSNADEQEAIDALLEHYWLEQAIEHYRRLVERCIAEMGTVRDENRMVLVREARDSLMRLVQARGYRDAGEEEDLAGMHMRIGEIERLKNAKGGMSPILLSLESCRSLDELVAPELAVPFDLDGDAVDELWPWIAPGTGWLVWDPRHRGEITSGQQLFGTASGWLFFPDGYRVLDALDDDRSGELRGAELAGIAVWFDRDIDGVSDRGEVVPVEALGIVALATEATERSGASLGNPCGLELADGRILPTYDWVLEAAP